MALGFDKLFNTFAKTGTALNRGINKVIGKEVFQDIKPIEAPREFLPYNSFPEYRMPEPEQWPVLTGEAKKFNLEGSIIAVSSNLDACIKYVPFFKTSAEYYTEKFKFKYQQCVQDYDTLIHYFSDIYIECITSMIHRAYSLLLPFGVYSSDIKDFISRHMDDYRLAITSYEIMVNIEESKNQTANDVGNQVGSSVQMQGGGFGFKGALKGVAQAETFNLGMGILGKYVAQQNKMTQAEKTKVYEAFKNDVFFQEVYSDIFNTFYTMINFLSESGELDGVTTLISTDIDNMVRNLQNPMFPQEKVAPALAKLISHNPFIPACFELLKQKFGNTEEVNILINYFN